MTEDILQHCLEIERCNQRGGRMLSVADLIEAGTLTRELAAYSLAGIGAGASFLVGGMPGGAGKTTVMGALLNFVPPDVVLAPADGMDAIQRGRDADGRRCYLCHEIGRGGYYAYLWGEELRAYFDLPEAGHMLATNLHADTFEQTRDQICGDNDVSEAALRRMNLMFFLNVRRRIATVWESDGQREHRQVADDDMTPGESQLVSTAALARARETIDELLASGARTIDQVREYVVSAM